jgi:hypothetical protein
MSALVDELRALIRERKSVDPKGTPNQARKWMDRAAEALTTLQSRLEAVEAERDAALALAARKVNTAHEAYARQEELQKALADIRDFPKPGTSRRTDEGYPLEIDYDDFAYKRIVDSYREAAARALSPALTEEGKQ